MNTKYSAQENTFIRLNAPNLTDAELRYTFHRNFGRLLSPSAITKQRQRLGIARRSRRKKV